MSPTFWTCGKCSTQNATYNQFCGQCGQARPPAETLPPPQGISTKKILVILGIVMGVGLVIALLNPETYRQPGQQQRTVPTDVSATPTPTQPLTPAEHLAEAKKQLNYAVDVPVFASIRPHLQAIPPKAPEYREAQQLLKQIAEREQDIANEAHPLEVVKSTWERGGFNTVAVWHVTFYNRSKRPVGDITYRTTYYSETGNKVDAGGVDAVLGNNMIQKVISPGQKRTLEINDGFLHSQAVRATFELVDWRFVDK